MTNSFTGKARLWVADAVLKWAPNGNATHTQLQAAGRVLPLASRTAALTYDDTRAGDAAVRRAVSDYFKSDQSGWYAQGVWQFMPRWRVGYRYDRLRYGTVDNGIVSERPGPDRRRFPAAREPQPDRATPLMLDWSPTEFSRFRLQLARDKSRLGAHRQPGLPAVHPQPGRARRAQVLRPANDMETNMNRMLMFVVVIAAGSWRRRRPLAALNIFACEPEWGALAKELAGDKASIYVATTALQDPHRIEARPSLIARARIADLVVCTGAELEIGWLPLVQTQSGNAKIQAGQPGYFEAARFVTHAGGAAARSTARRATCTRPAIPHVHLDPRNIAKSRGGARRAHGAARSRRGGALPRPRAGVSRALAGGDRALGEGRRAAEGHADRRLPQEPVLPRATGSACARSARSSPSRACRRPRRT